jgi:hypothetical protein
MRVLFTWVTETRAEAFCPFVKLMVLLTVPFSVLLAAKLSISPCCWLRVCGGRGISPSRRPAYSPRRLRSQSGSSW